MKNLLKTIGIVLVVFSLSLTGCSKDTDNDEPIYTGPTNKEAQTVELNGGQLILDIPAGAMPEGAEISMKESEVELPESAPVLQQFELLPKGTKFLKPVTLTLKYTDELLRGNSPYALGLAFQNDKDKKWYALVGGKVDTQKKTISTKITHFSNWGVFSALHLYAKVVDKTYHDGQEVIPLLTKQQVTVGVVMDLPPLSADDEEMIQIIKKVFELMKKDPVNPKVSEDCPDCALFAPVTFNPPVKTDDIHNKVIEPDKWLVNGIINGNAQTGTIESYVNRYFTYTSPVKMPLDNPMAIAAVIHTKSHGDLQLIQQTNVYARKWKLQIIRSNGHVCDGIDDFGYAFEASYGGSVEFEMKNDFELANVQYKVQPLEIISAGNCNCMTGIHIKPMPNTGIFMSNLRLVINDPKYEVFQPFQIVMMGDGGEYAEFKATWTTDDCGVNPAHTESENYMFNGGEYQVEDFPLGVIPDTPLKTTLDEDGETTIEAIE